MVECFAAGERGETGDVRSALFIDLLRGTGRNDHRLSLLAADLGIDLAQPFALLVVPLDSHDELERSGRLRSAVQEARLCLRGSVLVPAGRGTSPHGTLVVPLRDGGAPLQASRRQEVVDAAERLVQHGERSVLAAPPVAGAERLRETYLLVQRLLPAARRLLDGAAPRLLSPEELRLQMLLLSSAPSVQDELVEDLLGPILRLPAQQAAPLLRALEVLCATSRLPDAARRLHVHANTVKYRRDRLEELCGRSLADGDDRLNLWLAVRLAALLGRVPAAARA